MNEDELVSLLDEMIAHQQKKVLRIARELAPGVTQEDIRNSFDFPQLAASQRFNFEDGILSGYISVRTAVLSKMNQHHG